MGISGCYNLTISPEIPMPTEQDDRHKAYMEADFPASRSSVAPEFKMVNAAEYSAYQLGQISQSLKKIVALLEKGAK